MPLVSLPVTTIELPVSDRRSGATVVKQKARYHGLNINQQADGTCSVLMQLSVTQYAATEAGEYGERLTWEGVSSYPKTLVADNNTAVDPQSGAILYILVSSETVLDFVKQQYISISESSWHDFLNSRPEALALQGDFFCVLRDTQDIRIRFLIEHHIEAADAMGRFT
ncbi:hypothetical protein [Hymenobacter sp. YC55]|uniref:hypothetical protein n=1 Tax=Hymenobacter sp. YC55 TaxID=3034019 RepID=UPI0023F72AA2|nr:hypothetical protein [Hymenobacter sp. YC55]MDF7809901.1 hypothetical protein [Hymenobacter sp. YC55]